MASIFTKIINGEIPCYKIAETEDFFAFLDIFPLQRGHVLVVPKKEIDYYFDLEDELLAGLTIFSKKIAQAIRLSIDCSRVGVVVMGLEVPHAHVHLIPMHTEKDMDFNKPKLSLSKEEFVKIAQSIQANI